jgi:head-tail adaptor
MPPPRLGELDRRITFEEKGSEKDPDSNAAIEGDWAAIATDPHVWARVLDVRPSRGEVVADGVETATRPAMITIRWRNDISSAMRIVVWVGEENGEVDRVMQIVTEPVSIFGRRNWMEFKAEEYSSAAEAI